MADKVWRGDAPAVAQVVTLTVGGTVEVGDVFNVTINGKTVSTAATTTSTATTATEIKTALAASTIPEFKEVTWTVNGSVVTGTAATAGKPFTVTIATTESGGGAADAQTFVLATPTASSGPNDWSTAANWSPSGVPASSDTVTIDQPVDILYGLDQNAVSLASLDIRASAGKIGLPKLTAQTGGYIEYRPRELTIGIASAGPVTIGQGAGQGSSRIRLNLGTSNIRANVYSTGTAAGLDEKPLYLRNTHASSEVNVLKGKVAIATEPGDTSQLSKLRVGYTSSIDNDCEVVCGAGLTLATLEKTGGKVELNKGATTITADAGDLYINDDDGVTTLTARKSARVYYNSTGTLGTATLSGKAVLDFSRDMRTKTVTNPIEVYGDAQVFDPFKVVTSLVLDLNENNGIKNHEIGTNIRVTRGTVA